MDYKETIKERLKILSDQLRSFILDENWRRDAENIGEQFGFNEEKYALLENEIFLVLLCFEPKEDFKENIQKEVGLDSSIAERIVGEVNRNIFSKVANEIDSMWQSEEREQPKSTGVGNSFEQIILNQARAMQPARPQGETGGSTKYEVRGTSGKEEKPENLPTESKPQYKVPDYRGSGDPYREPLG